MLLFHSVVQRRVSAITISMALIVGGETVLGACEYLGGIKLGAESKEVGKGSKG